MYVQHNELTKLVIGPTAIFSKNPNSSRSQTSPQASPLMCAERRAFAPGGYEAQLSYEKRTSHQSGHLGALKLTPFLRGRCTSRRTECVLPYRARMHCTKCDVEFDRL